MGHIHRKDEFKHAISAATVHDFFNILVVLILFPLELLTGYLSAASSYFANSIPLFTGTFGEFSLMSSVIDPISNFIISMVGNNTLLILSTALVLLIVSLRSFTLVLKNFIVGKSQKVIDKYVFAHPVRSLCWGAVITAGVQSSSVTASLTVPLVASDRVSLRKVFPFLIGANVGTTLTAMVAALSQSETAIAIAMCHLFFNLFGVFLLFPIKHIRYIPVWFAEKLRELSYKNRIYGILYVFIVFFIIPSLILLSQAF